eukprot:COSAG06_NODE_3692_length_5000_cov_23.651296_2_plen_338_part_00
MDGYGYLAPPPSQDVVHPTLDDAAVDTRQHQHAEGDPTLMSAELQAAKRRGLAAQLETQRDVLAEREDLREQLLQQVQLVERELTETQREARIERGHIEAASHRSELERQLLEARWREQEARADRAMARREAQQVAERFAAKQREQHTLVLQAIGLEAKAASAHERAEQLRLGIVAQRSRNASLVKDLGELAQPMGANVYLRGKLQELQELQGDLIAQLARHKRVDSDLKRASSRQLMEHAGLAPPPPQSPQQQQMHGGLTAIPQSPPLQSPPALPASLRTASASAGTSYKTTVGGSYGYGHGYGGDSRTAAAGPAVPVRPDPAAFRGGRSYSHSTG